MEIIDIFLQDSKDKFLNNLIKIPKKYSWYLGLVVSGSIDYKQIEEKCEKIYDKSEEHLKLLNILDIQGKYGMETLILFATDPIPYSNNIKGIIKSIAKYLDCKTYEVTYIKYFRQMIFDAWGEQQYYYIIDHTKSEEGVAYDLTAEKEG